MDLHKTVHVDIDLARDLEQLTLDAVHGEREAGGGTGGHRERGLASRVVDHQRTLGLGGDDHGGAGLRQRQTGAETACHWSDLHAGHVLAEQAATKAQFKGCVAEKAHRDAGTCDAGQGRVQEGLHCRLVHAGADFTSADGLAAVGQRQGVAKVAGDGVHSNALHLAAGAHALGDVGGLDHGQAQLGKVAGDVGHIDLGLSALEAQHQAGLPPHTGGAIHRDEHIARADGGHGLQARLHARGQKGLVGRVNNGRTELVAQGDAETAAGQLRIDIERGNLHLGQVCAGQCAVKAHQVGVGAIGSDGDRALARQRQAVAGRGGAQGRLHGDRRGAQGNAGAGIGVARMREAEGKLPGGAGSTVNGDALDLEHRGGAVLHQRVFEGRAGEGDGLAGNVGLVQGTHKAHHITLSVGVAGVVDHADVGGAGLQQVGVGLAQRADVERHTVGHAAGHIVAAAFLSGSGLPFDLQSQQVERLPSQTAARGDREAVAGLNLHAELRAGDSKSALEFGLDLRLGGAAGDLGGGVGLPLVAQAELVTQAQGF